MLKIFRYLKSSWLSVVMILLLLVVQAYCDLSLPQYTSDIVDVGIQQGGVETAALDTISAGQFSKLLIFDKDNALESCYTVSGDSAVLNEGCKEKAEEAIAYPAAVVFALDNADMSQMASGEMPALPEGMKLTDALLSMPEEQRSAVTDKINGTFGEYSDMMLEQMAIGFASAELEAQGVDMDKLRMDYIKKTGLKMLLFALVMTAASIICGFLSARTAAQFGLEVRDKVFRKVVSFSNAEMEKFSTASLITRSTNDIQQLQMVIVMLLRMVAYAPIIGIGGIIKVIGTKSGLGWIIGVAVGLVVSLVVILMAVALPKFKIMQSLVDRLNLVTREILTGLPVIRAFSREKYEEERFDTANKNLMRTQLFTNRVMTFMMPAMMFIMNGVAIAIVWFGGKGIDAGTMQVGDMMAFITYTMQIIMAFLMLTMISIMLPRAAVSAGRINEVLATENSVADSDSAAEEGITEGRVSFEDVSFRYGDADADVLENITFTAEPGQTTAIIGSTGSGKSTLINLVPRFFDVTGGKITIDGKDVRSYSQHYLRENIGLVPQKGVLFSGTIASNLRFGNADATDEEIQTAADIAQATDFIMKKPEKFDDPVAQGGSNVSGGQKQRLSIARAIAKNPKIYIFDDSFSALDYKTDAALRKALMKKVRGASVIIVAQRISTILHADKIVVLDDGKVAGIGTHSELMENCEVYRQIAYSQLSEKELNGKEAG